MMHICMMHLSMILDPDTCMYDAYIYNDTLDYGANMYDALQQFETTGLPITVAVKDKVVISKYIFLSIMFFLKTNH